MQSILVGLAGLPGGVGIAAVGLGDGQGIGHFHDSALDSLQFITRPGEHEQQEKIGHAVYCRFGLPHAHGFHDNHFVARRLAKQHGLARAARNTAQRSACG